MSSIALLRYGALWVAFFLIALMAARLGTELPGSLTLGSGVEEIKQWGGEHGDPTSYILYGEDLMGNGAIEGWYPRCFPPGLAAINAAILFLGLGKKMALWLQLVSLFLWATALLLVFLSFDPHPGNFSSSALKFILVNSLWLFPSMRDWGLGIGTLYSESKAHPIFLIACVSVILALRKPNWRSWALAGLGFAVCAYLRVYFEKLGIFVFAGFLTALLIGLARRTSLERSSWKSLLILPFTFLTVFQLAVIPWSVRNLHSRTVGMYGMAPAQMHITFYHLWETSEKLPPILGPGGNTACLTDPRLCQELHEKHGRVLSDSLAKEQAILTLLKHPITWYRHRLSAFNEFWIGAPYTTSHIGKFIEGNVAYLITLLSLVFAVAGTASRNFTVRNFAWFVLAFYGFNVAAFTFAGMDVDGRHSLTIRLFAYFSLFWLLALRKENLGYWGLRASRRNSL